MAAGAEGASNNKRAEPLWRESPFDPGLPDDEGEISGASETSDPEDGISLRVAYGIWSGRRWMAKPRTKKRKTV